MLRTFSFLQKTHSAEPINPHPIRLSINRVAVTELGHPKCTRSKNGRFFAICSFPLAVNLCITQKSFDGRRTPLVGSTKNFIKRKVLLDEIVGNGTATLSPFRRRRMSFFNKALTLTLGDLYIGSGFPLASLGLGERRTPSKVTKCNPTLSRVLLSLFWLRRRYS